MHMRDLSVDGYGCCSSIMYWDAQHLLNLWPFRGWQRDLVLFSLMFSFFFPYRSAVCAGAKAAGSRVILSKPGGIGNSWSGGSPSSCLSRRRCCTPCFSKAYPGGWLPKQGKLQPLVDLAFMVGTSCSKQETIKITPICWFKWQLGWGRQKNIKSKWGFRWVEWCPSLYAFIFVLRLVVM